MDLTTLEQNLTDALTQVIQEESVLQSAIDAVKAALPTTVQDPVWAAVQSVLTTNGWTAPTAATGSVSTGETGPSA